MARRAAHAADRRCSSPTARGRTTAFALLNLQERGSLFVGPGTDVYEGMIVGENARAEDLDVNADQGEEAHQHALLDLRRAGAPDPAAARCSLDQALEFIREDECVEVTPAERAPAQGRALGAEAPDRREPQGARARRRLVESRLQPPCQALDVSAETHPLRHVNPVPGTVTEASRSATCSPRPVVRRDAGCGQRVPVPGTGCRRRYPPAMAETMTQAQYDKLAADLAEMEGPKRAEIVDAIRVARGFGDLSENFEYHSAKNEQGLLERRITILRARLEAAEVVEGAGADVVTVGHTIVVENETAATASRWSSRRSAAPAPPPPPRRSAPPWWASASATPSRSGHRAGHGRRRSSRSSRRARRRRAADGARLPAHGAPPAAGRRGPARRQDGNRRPSRRAGRPRLAAASAALLLGFDDEPVGVVETTEVQVVRAGDVDVQFARDEGEGFESVADWREAHERFWAEHEITDDTLIVAERFRLLRRLAAITMVRPSPKPSWEAPSLSRWNGSKMRSASTRADEGAGVGHGQVTAARHGASADPDVTAGDVVADGVVDQVRDEAFDQHRVARDDGRLQRGVHAPVARGRRCRGRLRRRWPGRPASWTVSPRSFRARRSSAPMRCSA